MEISNTRGEHDVDRLMESIARTTRRSPPASRWLSKHHVSILLGYCRPSKRPTPCWGRAGHRNQTWGHACVQHLLLRLMLKSNGSVPWQYVNFLDYAADRIPLRKVGGGYRFIHQLLQNYCAARHVEPGGGSRAARS